MAQIKMKKESPVKRGRRSRDEYDSDLPNPVDIFVGSRLRTRRTLMGVSQERLGDVVGITFQQIQKYERGTNRISASRLFEFSRALDIPVSYFFEGLESPAKLMALAEEQSEFDGDLMTRRETLELVKAYYRIKAAQVRRKVLDLARALGSSLEEE